MKTQKPLMIDADLIITNQSGSSISLRLDSGQGVVELSDAAVLRKIIKHSLTNRQSRGTLRRILNMAKALNPRIDISIVGKRVARVDTQHGGGLLCGLMGLPGLRVRPIALLSVWFK